MDVLVLGCSQSAGAELSDSLAEGYWDRYLAMKDPYNEWFKPGAANIRVNKFHEFNNNRKEDWNYNYLNAYPGVLQQKLGDRARVISAARSGSGVSWVDFLNNINDHYYTANDETQKKLIKAQSDLFHRRGMRKPQTLGWKAYMENTHLYENPETLEYGMYETMDYHLLTSLPERKLNRFKGLNEAINPSIRTKVNHKDPKSELPDGRPDYKYLNDAMTESTVVKKFITKHNEWMNETHGKDYYCHAIDRQHDLRGMPNVHYIRDYSEDFTVPGWEYTYKDFSELLLEADILVWQWTNEPRKTFTHPSHDKVETSPQAKILDSTMASLQFDIEIMEFEHQRKYWKEYKKLDETGHERLHETLHYWRMLVEDQIESHLNHYDNSINATNIVNFTNYIILKRKSLGKKTIMTTLDMSQMKPYNISKRLELDALDGFINLSRHTSLRMEEFNDKGFFLDGKCYARPHVIKERIREGTWPYQQFMHFSKHAHDRIADLIYKEIEKVI